jgi:hypothetical protein
VIRRTFGWFVSESVTAAQPPVWTFLEFEADDDTAGPLADALAEALLADGGWYADFRAGPDHVVVFAGQVSATGAAISAAVPKPWTAAGRGASPNTSWTGQTDPFTDPDPTVTLAYAAMSETCLAAPAVLLSARFAGMAGPGLTGRRVCGTGAACPARASPDW